MKKSSEEVLTHWESYCHKWSNAYHQAAQRTLTWYSRFVEAALIASALTTVVTTSTATFTSTGTSGSSGGWLGTVSIIVAVAGAIIAGVTTLANAGQKATFASPDQVKQYHSTAAAYGKAERQISMKLAQLAQSGTAGPDPPDYSDVRTQLDTIDDQAPELPERFKPGSEKKEEQSWWRRIFGG